MRDAFSIGSTMARMLAELATWYGIACVFLYFYEYRFAASSQAVLPHLSVLTAVLAALICTRVALWRWIPDRRLAALAGAFATTATLAIVVSYYVVTIIGLQFWGRVITWRLIASYTQQSAYLVESLGINQFLLWAILAVILICLFIAIYFIFIRSDWISGIARESSSSVMAIAFPAILCAILLKSYTFISAPSIAQGEPVSLTFFPDQVFKKTQGYEGIVTQALDLAEDKVRKSYVASHAASRRNVVIIVVDALRPDHMSLYGYARRTTPYLDGVQNAGNLTHLNWMVSACAESACGLMALARSKYVHQLSSRAFTLEDALRANGYAIRMILSGDHTNFYGLREAYGKVDSYFDGSMAKGYYMNDDEFVIDQVRKMPEWDKRPVMLQFHLMSAHMLGQRHRNSLEYLPAKNYGWAGGQQRIILDESDRRDGLNFYDDGVLQFDSTAHALLDELERKHYLDDALVVITADHGELLGEHDQYGHAKDVWQNAIQIPFVFLPFGYKLSKTLDKNVLASQIDIAPTILTELGMPIPRTWSGKALQENFSRNYIYFQQGAEIGLFAVDVPSRIMKYWKDFKTNTDFVYDVSNDPDERTNLIESIDSNTLREWRLAATATATAIH